MWLQQKGAQAEIGQEGRADQRVAGWNGLDFSTLILRNEPNK